MSASPHILLVEDDAALVALVGDFLAGHGMRVASEGRGDRAVERVLAERPDLVVLDVGLPGIDGLTVCRRLRPFFAGPILMLTARGDPSDEVLGFDLGVDDYVAKPVQPRVLLARIQALLRRFAATPQATAFAVGALAIDPTQRTAWLDGRALELTSGELDLLCVLAEHAGRVVTREVLLERLRGESYERWDRSIDQRVSKLRQKLGAHAGLVKTVRRVGYQLALPGKTP